MTYTPLARLSAMLPAVITRMVPATSSITGLPRRSGMRGGRSAWITAIELTVAGSKSIP